MTSHKAVLELVGHLYEAATDVDRWPFFLESLTKYFNATGAQFRFTHIKEDTFTLSFTYGYDDSCGLTLQEANALYEPLTQTDPRMQMGFRFPGKPISCRLHVGEKALHDSEAYKQVLSRIGAEYSMAVFLPDEGERTFTGIGMWRGRGLGYFDKQEAELFGELVPHIRRALALFRQFSGLTADLEMTKGLLDDMGVGVVLVDSTCHVTYVNATARMLATSHDGFSLIGNRLVANNAALTRRIKELVADIASAVEAGRRVDTVAMNIPRLSSAQPYHVLIGGISRSIQNLGETKWGSPEAALFITDPERSLEDNCDLLQRLFGLTNREAKLLEQLVNGVSLDEACQRLGISKDTGRTHLKSIFRKTGVSRQTELVRLVMSTAAWMRSTSEGNCAGRRTLERKGSTRL